MRTLIHLASEWSSREIQLLVNAALHVPCPSFVLVVRTDMNIPGMSFLIELEPYLTSKRRQDRWPGTITFELPLPLVCKYELTPSSASILASRLSSPWVLQTPQFPEDLSFLRADGTVWFASISHERDAYFSVDEQELLELRGAFGGLQLEPEGPDTECEARY
jgi:hypothetical protein